MTISFSGITGSESAPVEETIVFSSNSKPGKGVGSDPVAMMMFLEDNFYYP